MFVGRVLARLFPLLCVLETVFLWADGCLRQKVSPRVSLNEDHSTLTAVYDALDVCGWRVILIGMIYEERLC